MSSIRLGWRSKCLICLERDNEIMICHNCGGTVYTEAIEDTDHGKITINKCESCHQSSNQVFLRKTVAAHKWAQSILRKT